jgi:hypothetical protein
VQRWGKGEARCKGAARPWENSARALDSRGNRLGEKKMDRVLQGNGSDRRLKTTEKALLAGGNAMGERGGRAAGWRKKKGEPAGIFWAPWIREQGGQGEEEGALLQGRRAPWEKELQRGAGLLLAVEQGTRPGEGQGARSAGGSACLQGAHGCSPSL